MPNHPHKTARASRWGIASHPVQSVVLPLNTNLKLPLSLACHVISTVCHLPCHSPFFASVIAVRAYNPYCRYLAYQVCKHEDPQGCTALSTNGLLNYQSSKTRTTFRVQGQQ